MKIVCILDRDVIIFISYLTQILFVLCGPLWAAICGGCLDGVHQWAVSSTTSGDKHLCGYWQRLSDSMPLCGLGEGRGGYITWSHASHRNNTKTKPWILHNAVYPSDQSGNAPSKWKTLLHCNISHLLGTYLDWSLISHQICWRFCFPLFWLWMHVFIIFAHILQRCLIVILWWLPQYQWSNPEGYGLNWPAPNHNNSQQSTTQQCVCPVHALLSYSSRITIS